MNTTKFLYLFIMVLLAFTSCSQGSDEGISRQMGQGTAVEADEMAMAEEIRPDFSSPTISDPDLVVADLPEELTWYTSKPGVFGSSRAKQGGTKKAELSEYPLTFRTVGPNANGGFRGYLLAGAGLVGTNPETNEWIPMLATHWAFSADGKTVYFKLNENALWNDGEKVTSDDYLFLLEMMRDESLQAPWYNNYYSTQLGEVQAYGDYVISVSSPIERQEDDLLLHINIGPRPRHFYPDGIQEDWVDTQQWVYEPTVGPYRLSSFEKGESVTFEKTPDWWGYDYEYNAHRFNEDSIVLKVITGGRDIQKQYFLNGEIDTFKLIIPKDWADSEGDDAISKGYIDRHYSFFVPLTGVYGIVLNTESGILQSQDVRTGLYSAVNMDKMIATVLRGEYPRYHNIGLAHVFAGVDFDDSTIRQPEFDPKKAGEYFDKAGYSTIGNDGIRLNERGERLTFELLYPASHHTERLSVLKEEAKKSGLDISLNNMTEGSFAVLLDKKHQAFFLGMSTSIQPSYWEYFHSDNAKEQSNNFFMLKNEELDGLIMDYRGESDLIKKAEISKAIQRKVHDLALVIPSYTVPYDRGASWKWVRYPSWLNTKYNDDFLSSSAYNSMGGYTGYGWIDEKIKREVIQAKNKGESFEPRTFIDETNKQ